MQTPRFDFAARLKKLQRLIEKKRVDALALAALDGFDANAFYYSGDETFPTTLLVTPDYTTIYSLHAHDFKHLFNDCLPASEVRNSLRKKLRELRVHSLAVDDFSSSAGAFLRLQQKMLLKLKPIGGEVAQMRLVKDAQEIKCIKKAREISLKAVQGLDEDYFAGKSEHVVAGGMELATRRNGAALDAFPAMVLSGARSAFFHNSTSNKRISRNEPVLVDWGARFAHYCSDHTRTFYAGKEEKIRDAIEAVKEAKKAAEKKAKVGASGKALAQASLKVINEYGFGKHSFRRAGLSIGHFVGLNVHDTGERLERTRLRKGMAFTIEPGVYVPNEFGVRFEDTFVLE